MRSSDRPSWSRRTATLALRLVIAGAALALTLLFASRIGWAELWARFRSADAVSLFAAVLLLLLRWAAWSHRWNLVLRRVTGPQPASRTFLAVMASVLVNLVSPWVRVLGGLSRARFLAAAAREPFAKVYGSVLYDQAIHHGVVFLVTWVALIAGATAVGRPILAGSSAALLVATLVALTLVARRRGSGPHPILAFLERQALERPGRAGRWAAYGHEAGLHFARLFRDGPLLAWSIVLSALMFLSGAAAQWAIFVALGRPVGLATVVAVVALGNAAGLLSGTPGGVGTTEAAMIGCYVLLGVAQVDGVAGTFLFRGLHYLLVVGIGLPALLRFEVARRG